MSKAIIILFLSYCYCNAKAQVWQWSIEVDSIVSSETNQPPRAFLWIPENCTLIRGVVVGQHNMLEEGILEHPLFRRTLTELGFAEVWVTPMFSQVFDFTKDAIPVFNGMMKKLGKVSGYTELAFAPVVPIGHSALASYPWNFAASLPERTLAVLSIHGDAPLTHLTGSGKPNPDWRSRTIGGIPGLMVVGENEWWIDRVKPALAYQQMHPQAPVSLLGDAGRGHFDYSDQLVQYLSLFVRKAAQCRLPPVIQVNGPVKLKGVAPTEGWLADRFRPDTLPLAKAAPYGQYKGDRREAFWYFDKEIAMATEKYYLKERGKKNRFIGFMQNDTLLPCNLKNHARYLPVFQPLPDGVSFHMNAVFTDSLHNQRMDNYTEGKIKINRICGPIQKLDDTTFSIRFYRMGFNNAKRSGDIWLLAENEGSAHYKSAVQQANIRIPVINKEGQPQEIRFPSISSQKVPLQPLMLTATATSQLPVYYYVMEGPVEIKNGKLVFTPIPPRSKFPVKVTVVAWQYGRAILPKIQTAEPVFQTFYILKNNPKNRSLRH